MSATHDIEPVLRTLDAAEPARPDLSPRAWADLERIVGEKASTPPVKEPVGAQRRDARRAARLLPIAAAAAGAAVLSLSLLDSAPSAYASWTALPTGDPVVADSPGATMCSQWWAQDAATANLEPVLAERRGDYTLVVGEGPGGQESACLARSDFTGGTSTQLDHGAGITDAETVRVTIYDTSSYSAASSGPDTTEEAHSIVSGRVGEGVTSIVVNTPQQGAVQATIADGRFAAWWPWDKTWTGAPHPDISFDLQIANGTLMEDVPLKDLVAE